MKAPSRSCRLLVMLLAMLPLGHPSRIDALDAMYAGETLMTIRSVIGDTPRRREDARFVTGGGAYLDDLAFDHLAHAVVLRSPHAHARIDSIDVAAALAAPGVLAVLTAADAGFDGLQPMRPTVEANVQTGEPFA